MSDGLPLPRRFWAICAISFGNALTVLDGSIVMVALPTIARKLEIDNSSAVLVVIVYQLVLVMAVFTVLTLVGTWALGGSSALADGRGARESRAAALDRVLPALLVLGAVAVLVWVVLTGDAGARAVWG